MAGRRTGAGPGPRKGGGPVTGIPGTESAGKAPNGVTRALLRIAVLVGLVVCGWLLGTGISAADEAEPGDHPGTRDWVHVSLDHEKRSAPAPDAPAPDAPAPTGTRHSDTRHFSSQDSGIRHSVARPAPAGHQVFAALARSAATVHTDSAAGTPDTGAGDLLGTLAGEGLDPVVQAGEVLRLPAQLPDLAGTDLAGPVVAPLQPVLESALHPVTTQVLGTTAQQPDRPAPSATADAGPLPPAVPVAVPRAPVPAHTSPPVQAAAPVTAAAPSGTAQPVADQLAASAAAGNHSTSTPAPAEPRATAPVSCPPGSTGTNTVHSAGYAATLTDGLAKADPALVRYRLATGAGGLPRCPSQQPSTSPD